MNDRTRRFWIRLRLILILLLLATASVGGLLDARNTMKVAATWPEMLAVLTQLA
jgi:hypothetical protein